MDAKGSLDDRKEGNEEASDNGIRWDWETGKDRCGLLESKILVITGRGGGKKTAKLKPAVAVRSGHHAKSRWGQAVMWQYLLMQISIRQ